MLRRPLVGVVSRLAPRLAALALALSGAAGCAPDDDGREPEAGLGAGAYPPVRQGTSWLGEPLMSREPTPEEAVRIAAADSALEEDPDDVARLVAAARVREDIWRYAEAVSLYGRAMARAPERYDLPLARGHRLIRLRSLDEAMTELDRALVLDPTGFNTAYLRGLTLYLQGRFREAARVYRECLALAGFSIVGTPEGDPRQCAHLGTDPASRVAMTAWAVRAHRRAGEEGAARDLLEALPAEVDTDALDGPFPEYEESPIVPGDNSHYWALLRYFRGGLPVDSLMNRERWGGQWPTVAYGVAAWWLGDGEEEKARVLLEEIVDDPNWARLGHVAAEADLVRLLGEDPSS